MRQQQKPTRVYMPWPEDGRPAAFGPIADAICKAIRFAYKLERRNQKKDIPWKGPNIGKADRMTCLEPFEQLSAESLRWAKDDQGRDALDEIIGLALRLGIEQGRRISRDTP